MFDAPDPFATDDLMVFWVVDEGEGPHVHERGHLFVHGCLPFVLIWTSDGFLEGNRFSCCDQVDVGFDMCLIAGIKDLEELFSLWISR